LIELLGLTGDRTAEYYESVDPDSPGESVGFFGARAGEPSPFWQAIAREYMERWIHHSQILRALGRPSLAERRFLSVGVEVAAAVGRMEPGIPTEDDGEWRLGPVGLGPAAQTADILTRGLTADEIKRRATGPAEIVELLAALTAR